MLKTSFVKDNLKGKGRTLNASGYGFDEIERGVFGSMPKLQELDLSNNNLKSLAIESQTLTQLDISNNELEDLDGVLQLATLQSILCSGNRRLTEGTGLHLSFSMPNLEEVNGKNAGILRQRASELDSQTVSSLETVVGGITVDTAQKAKMILFERAVVKDFEKLDLDTGELDFVRQRIHHHLGRLAGKERETSATQSRGTKATTSKTNSGLMASSSEKVTTPPTPPSEKRTTRLQQSQYQQQQQPQINNSPNGIFVKDGKSIAFLLVAPTSNITKDINECSRIQKLIVSNGGTLAYYTDSGIRIVLSYDTDAYRNRKSDEVGYHAELIEECVRNREFFLNPTHEVQQHDGEKTRREWNENEDAILRNYISEHNPQSFTDKTAPTLKFFYSGIRDRNGALQSLGFPPDALQSRARFLILDQNTIAPRVPRFGRDELIESLVRLCHLSEQVAETFVRQIIWTLKSCHDRGNVRAGLELENLLHPKDANPQSWDLRSSEKEAVSRTNSATKSLGLFVSFCWLFHFVFRLERFNVCFSGLFWYFVLIFDF